MNNLLSRLVYRNEDWLSSCHKFRDKLSFVFLLECTSHLSSLPAPYSPLAAHQNGPPLQGKSSVIQPEGAILREKDKSSLGQEVSKLCYCCCGLALNYLHKLTFNPFLVIALESDLQDLESSLALVQEAYHQQNPWLDRSSLWVYFLECRSIDLPVISASACFLLYVCV